jgi:hypothetical protein
LRISSATATRSSEPTTIKREFGRFIVDSF